MAGTKLKKLKAEIDHYLGIPYFTNSQKLAKDNLYVGKADWQEIKSFSSDYKILKKNHIGIDCSGLAVRLLNFFFDLNLDVRKTSADNLTSPPLTVSIDPKLAQTGDLIRQKNGHHVIFIIEKKDHLLFCVDSSRQGRGVRYSTIPISQKLQIFRLISLPLAPDT